MNFWEIYDQHYKPVKNFISKMLGDEWAADDLTQDTFMKVQKRLNSLKDKSKLRSWIFRIARNTCVDYFRSSSNENRDKIYQDNLIGSFLSMAHTQMEQNQMSNCVQDKIYLLPEHLRAVLLLFDTFEMNQKEIADILEITVANVKVRLHRARNALKDILTRDCVFEHDERSVLVCLPKKMQIH